MCVYKCTCFCPITANAIFDIFWKPLVSPFSNWPVPPTKAVSQDAALLNSMSMPIQAALRRITYASNIWTNHQMNNSYKFSSNKNMYSNKVCKPNAWKGIRSCDCFACLGMLRASSYIWNQCNARTKFNLCFCSAQWLLKWCAQKVDVMPHWRASVYSRGTIRFAGPNM